MKDRGTVTKALKIVLAAVFIVVGLNRINTKKGFMVDEVISYVFANSQYTGYIDPYVSEYGFREYRKNHLVGSSYFETVKNEIQFVLKCFSDTEYRAEVTEECSSLTRGNSEPQWISGDEFREFVDVRADQKFDYASVVYNTYNDASPPLYYGTLHTLSSLIDKAFEKRVGCYLNLFSMLIAALMVIRAGEILGCEAAGFAGASVFFLSKGGYEMILFNRMYAMAAMFASMMLVGILEILEHEKVRKSVFVLIFFAVLGGAMTHFYFLVYAFFLTAGGMLVLLGRKAVGKSFLTGVSSASGVIMSFILFPFSASMLFGDAEGRSGEAITNLLSGQELWPRFIAYVNLLGKEFIHIDWLWSIPMLIIITGSVFLIAGRQADVGRALNKCAVLAVPVLVFIAFIAKIAPYITDRYVMVVYPVFALSIMLFAEAAVRSFASGETASSVAVLALLIAALYSNRRTPLNYQRDNYEVQEMLSNEYSDKSAVYLFIGDMYSRFPEFMNYRQVLITSLEELSVRQWDPVFDKENEVILINEGNREEDFQRALDVLSVYGFTETEQLLEHDEYPWCNDVFLLSKR